MGYHYIQTHSPNLPLGVIQLPKTPAGTGAASALGSTGLFVPRGSRHRQVAFEFMKWATSDRYALLMARRLGHYPASAWLKTAPHFAGDPLLKPFLLQLELGPPVSPGCFPRSLSASLPRRSSLLFMAPTRPTHCAQRSNKPPNSRGARPALSSKVLVFEDTIPCPIIPCPACGLAFFNRWRGLRVQALVFTILPLAVMLALAVGAVFYAYQQVAEGLALSRDQELARVSAERLGENMTNFVRVLTTIANLDLVTGGDVGLQRTALTQARDLFADFDGGVLLLNADGIVTLTEPYRPDLLGQNLSNQSYFQSTRALHSYTFSDIIREAGSGEDIIVVAVPILARDGTFQGVLTGRFYVRFQRIGEEIQKLHVSDVGEAYLIDRNGRVIFHPDYALISADFSQRRSVFNLMRGEREGALFVQELGQPRQVVGYAIVGTTGWGLVIQEPWDAVVSPARVSLQPIILALLIGVGVVAFIVSRGVQRVIAPLTEMAAYSRQVAAGDYRVQVTPAAVRELRELGHAFNEMVEQIGRYQAGLRQYLAAITRSQEEERKRIARDLHDDTVQSLIAIGQRIELARETVVEDPQGAIEQLRELAQDDHLHHSKRAPIQPRPAPYRPGRPGAGGCPAVPGQRVWPNKIRCKCRWRLKAQPIICRPKWR